jgi:hypothetical protein
MWLKVQPEGNDQLAFTWGNTRGPYPCTYTVGRSSVLAVAADIRKILEALAKWSQFKDPAQLRKVLSDLVNEGARLRFVIFDSPLKAADVKDLQDWIAEQISAGDTELAITADSNLYVPWGFVFDGDAPDPEMDIGLADCAHFWSLKFRLSMVFSASGRPARSLRPRASYKLLSIVNRTVLADADEAVRNEFIDLFKVPVGAAYNLAHCDRLISEAARNDTLIHFFGHCRDGDLDLGDEKIDPTRFKMMVERLLARRDDRSSPYNLIFLNACETLSGDLDESFRSAAARPGLCGIVATEASVPQGFAAGFGLRFLKSMLVDGKSVGDTMETLRRDPALWPLNLLYSCYAYTDYRIVP